MWPNKQIKIPGITWRFGSGGRYARWRLLSIVAVGLIFASALYVGRFIYENIYSTIANANIIAAMESGLRIDAIDMKAYNLAKEKISLKEQPFAWPRDIRNIFEYARTPSTAAANANSSKKP